MCDEQRKVPEFLHKMIAAGCGFVSLSEEKVKGFIDDLVKRGELSANEGEGLLKNMLDRVESTGKDIENKVSETVKKYIKRENVCTKSEMDEILKRIEELEKRLAELEGKGKQV
jgi:polyhydroxyalkanoate synthesis regulator phasin